MANSEQLQFLNEWVVGQDSFDDCLLAHNLELHREARLEFLAECGESLSLVAHQGGFVAWQRGLQMEDTGASLCQLWAHSPGDDPHGLWQRASEGLESDFLMATRSPAGSPSSDLLKGLGYSLYRQRYVVTPQEHELGGPRMADFRLRLAVELDRPTICNIATDQVTYTVPPEFENDVEKIVRYTFDRFNSLDYGEDSATDIFLAEDRLTLKALGYILLHPGEPGTLYLDDMAVRRDYWGKYVGHFMIRSVENLMVEHEFQVLYADISQANRRSHVAARRQIGFLPFLEYWLKKS